MGKFSSRSQHRSRSFTAVMAVLLGVALLLSTALPTLAQVPGPDSYDLSITMTDSPDPVQVGQDLTYDVTVTADHGPTASINRVVMSDVLPAGVILRSVTPTAGPPPSIPCAAEQGVVTCHWTFLLIGQSATVSIVVTPTAAAQANARLNAKPGGTVEQEATTLTNVAEVSSATSDGGFGVEIDLEDNVAIATTGLS